MLPDPPPPPPSPNHNDILDLRFLLIVVGVSNVALLGRDWLKFIKLNWKEMFQVSIVKPKAKEILDKHKNVFKPAGPEDRIRGHKGKHQYSG